MTTAHDVPRGLINLENGCGVIAACMALRAFRKRISWTKLAKLCGHRKTTGAFAISIAVALKKCGVAVTFCTDPDDDKLPREIKDYRAALNLACLSGLP